MTKGTLMIVGFTHFTDDELTRENHITIGAEGDEKVNVFECSITAVRDDEWRLGMKDGSGKPTQADGTTWSTQESALVNAMDEAQCALAPFSAHK